MNTVCLIGDSHTARMYRSEQADCFDDLDIYFRGGQNLKQLACHENRLYIRDPDAQFLGNTQNEQIDLEKYDHIILYGCQVLSGKYGHEWIENYYDFTSNKYSSSCMKTIQLDCLRNTTALSVIDVIRTSDFRGSITVMPAPLPNINHPKIRMNSATPQQDILGKFQNTYLEFFEEMNIRYKSLPSELLSSNNYTVSEKYQNLRIGKQDNSHLNDAGCAIVLSEILKLADDLVSNLEYETH